MPDWRGLFLALVALVALAGPLRAADPAFPELTGPVVDAAGLLDQGTRADFDARLRAYQQSSGHQLVVATVPSLEGYDVRDYGNRLFRHWQLGDKQKNDGVLLLVAPNERKVSIEVGYGMEGDVTDALSKLIIENAITPRFRTGDFAGGIRAGLSDLQTAMGGGSAQVVEKLSPPENQIDPEVIFTILFWLFILYMVWRMSRGRVIVVSGPQYGRRSYSDWGGGGFGGGGGWSSGGGGFSGGGGSSGGGGASGSW
ncbi:MAG: TPM domain-containing protein [Hyphomicrobiales bacterium]